MSRIAYVNGRYSFQAHSRVSIDDRGYQFADGAYEVIWVENGCIFDEEPHLDRLDYSLAALDIRPPMSRAALKTVMREVLRRNALERGFIYMQVTRGVARRDHLFPKDAKPSLVVTARRMGPRNEKLLKEGVAVVSIPDIRWQRCDIKAIALLPNVLGKQQAKTRGAFESWLVNDKGFVTEGSASNAWIITGNREIITHESGPAILSGIARRAIFELASALQLKVVERPFTVQDVRKSAEAFLTSTTNFLLPVVSIDGHAIGDGKPGPITRSLHDAYLARLAKQSRRA